MIGGPQNLYNLFSQIPSEKYVILTGRAAIGSGLEKGGTWLDGEYVFFDQPQATKEKIGAEAAPAAGLATKTSGWVGFIKRIPGTSLLFYAWITGQQIVQMTHQGVRAVKKYDCSLILGISDSGPALISTFLIAKLTRQPHQYYLYDIYKGNNLQSIERWLASMFERKLMTSAEQVIVTNEGTEQHYQRRYGKNIRTAIVYNSVFTENYTTQRTPYKPVAPYTIVFTGHVYWAQEQAVINLIKAMALLYDLPVRLDLYIPKTNEAITRAVQGSSNIQLTAAAQSEMPRVQSQATLLFLPLAWDTKAPDIIATATPGKFTDYLASGRPMLIHAPSYAYVSQYTKQHNVGLVVDQNNPAELARVIRQFLTTPSVGQAYIDRALAIFSANHDAKKNAQKLTELLNMVG